MAHYRKIESNEKVYVQRNIFDDRELRSQQAKINDNGQEKTTALFFSEDANERFYELGVIEQLRDEKITIVSNDLSEILKYKTAETRREYIYNLIKENEQQLNQVTC